MNMSVDQYLTVSELLKTISHPVRLMILCHLVESPKTVSELEALCESSQSQISQFLNRMRREKIVAAKKEGRFVTYSISDKNIARLISAMHGIFCTPLPAKKTKTKRKDLL